MLCRTSKGCFARGCDMTGILTERMGWEQGIFAVRSVEVLSNCLKPEMRETRVFGKLRRNLKKTSSSSFTQVKSNFGPCSAGAPVELKNLKSSGDVRW